MGKVMKAKTFARGSLKKSMFKGGTPKEERKEKSIPLAQRGERGKGLKFNCTTFQTVSQFQPGTKIKYGPNPKTAGSKSFTRYAGYAKASTVGESLKMGSKLADLCWELERGQYKILGGVRSESAEKAALGEKWFGKAQKMLKCFNGPRGLNTNLNNPKAAEALAKEEVWRENKLKKVKELAKSMNIKIENEAELTKLGIHEAQELHAERKVCDFISAKRVKDAAKAGKKVSDKDLEEALGLWGFAQNTGRLNVMRDGIKYVYSDTIGAIRRRTGGYGITPATKHYPNFVKLLCTWLRDNHLEKKLGCDFKCTAINLNANYGAARHRDGNNEGPSVIRATGNFKGGKLKYWPLDTARPRPKVETLNKDECTVNDIKNETTIFDGTRAHEVEEFTGDRYSIVFFSANGFQKVPEKNVDYLKSLAMPWPTTKAMEVLKKATSTFIEGHHVKKLGLKKSSRK
jgi:hypothetical protein